MDHFLDVTKMVLFYARNVVRWTVRWTFRWTIMALQKRNVLIRWTFRWTLLTLLKADRGANGYDRTKKAAHFPVFKGRNSKEKAVFEGQNSQESAYL